ncbi:MAG TPA: GPW/gp25 family protein [Polyangia bacterium]|nr:GPW/gp25 family protein [Polyangia bacterium]
MTAELAYPFAIDGHGRTASTDEETHIRDLIEQVLFTTPGERVNRPNFGSGLLQAVFGPNSPELAATTQFLVQGALQQWLGDLVQIDNVQVVSEDSTLTVTVVYLIRETQQQKTSQFTRKV